MKTDSNVPDAAVMPPDPASAFLVGRTGKVVGWRSKPAEGAAASS